MTTFIVDYITSLLDTVGYAGLVIAMTLESMVFPLPSEAVMPFAGFLWSTGQMSFWLIVVWSTVGSLIGSMISYWIGLYGGRPFIAKYGSYFLLNEKHLQQTEEFFNKHGAKAIFIGRLVPVVRHLISIPAGLGKMNVWRFLCYTAVGATLWNTFLTIVGYYLGANWEVIKEYGHYLDMAVILAIILTGVWFWREYRKEKVGLTQEKN
ncbi:MAG: DedA family protein [Candidatus Paceibacterota bacterium]|jgi:membrane protein DedA with SNARE-associated domain